MTAYKASHEIIVEGDISSLDNLSVLKKFQNFLTLPYNNEKIDSYIAGLLKVIISRNIALNDSIKDRLQAKLKNTNSAELKSCGYSYNVKLMIDSNDRDKEFAYLYSLKNNENLYNEYIEKFSCEADGDEFIDEFYGDFVGSRYVVDMTSLLKFSKDTKGLKRRSITDRFIYTKANLIGQKLIDDYFRGLVDLQENFQKYISYLLYLFPEKSVNDIVNGLKLYFWDRFNFDAFKYDNKAVYEEISYRSNQKAMIVNELIEILDVIIINRNMSTKSLENFFDKEAIMLSDKDKKAIINEIQRVCVARCSKKKNLDFWMKMAEKVSELSDIDMAEFIIENEIEVITNIEYLSEEFETARYFKNSNKTERFLRHLSRYAEQSDDKKYIVEIINNIKKRDKISKKNEKNELKNIEKQNKTKRNDKTDDKFTIGSNHDEKGKHFRDDKDKKRGLLSFFNKKNQ